MDFANRAAHNFAAFARSYDGTKARSNPGGMLQGYLLAWLERGDGLEDTGGDFGVFMQAAVIIIQRWIDDPGILHLEYFEGGQPKQVERTVNGVFDIRGRGALCFDRDYYNHLVFKRHLGVQLG